MRSLAKKVLGSMRIGVVLASAGGSLARLARLLNHQSISRLLAFCSGRLRPKPAAGRGFRLFRVLGV